MLISASTGSLQLAAGAMSGAAAPAESGGSLPSTGHAGADAALAHFTTTLQAQAAALAEAAHRGSTGLSICARNFETAGQ